MLWIGIMMVLWMNWLCWINWCFTMLESETLMSSYGMKWTVESEGGVLSNTDARVNSTLRRVLWSGWYFLSYAMVVTRWGELPKPTFVVDKSKAGNVMWLLMSSSGTFGWPLVLRFFEAVFVVTMSFLEIVERADISSWFNSRFIRALTTPAFATCCSVNAVLIYLMNPILALRCVLYLSCDN